MPLKRAVKGKARIYYKGEMEDPCYVLMDSSVQEAFSGLPTISHLIMLCLGYLLLVTKYLLRIAKSRQVQYRVNENCNLSRDDNKLERIDKTYIFNLMFISPKNSSCGKSLHDSEFKKKAHFKNPSMCPQPK